MKSRLRGGYLSGVVVVVGAVVGDVVVEDAELHERCSPLWCCCWICG
jgi:hypothetical protein